MNPAKITDVLLVAATDLAATLALPISLPGRRFDPPTGRYLEVIEFKNTTNSPSWGGDAVFIGILQISVHQPNNDEGVIPATLIQDQIAAAFPMNRMIRTDTGNVKISQVPSVLTPITEPEKTIFPVSIPYLASRRENA